MNFFTPNLFPVILYVSKDANKYEVLSAHDLFEAFYLKDFFFFVNFPRILLTSHFLLRK